MIDRPALLRDLQKEVTALEAAIAERIAVDPQADAHLRAEHETARAAGRTAESFEMWRGEQITQSAVAWVLACVFIRFLEDNELLPTPHLSGPGPRRQIALDQRQLYFQRHPTETDREYLQDVFRQVATLPAAGDLLAEKHNPLWALAPSGDGATRLLTFFQRIVPETGEIAHDFTDPSWNTRFLGDLYQDLSESARKKYALLQTPEFVEGFILDRTLTPAIDTFGYQDVRLIDPTCGSGHFLLGAFHRLFALHQKHAPGTNPRELAQRALDQVAGVDLNPFAVAIARFRLLLAALRLGSITRLADAPGFRIHLATGDSLLHGKRFGRGKHFGVAMKSLQRPLLGADPLRHVYEAEDAHSLSVILGHQYHAVVGNPPYKTVKDKALNEAYRQGYGSCHRQYSLGVPFTERFFELALSGGEDHPAGFVGMITANSFMKREFGKKLIEDVLHQLDLTHVIDTSGATNIRDHGTSTVILFGRNRSPSDTPIRTAMGIRGEPTTPKDPSEGRVWRSIISQIDQPGSRSDFISVSDYERSRFAAHPWSLGGGGAAELKQLLESRATPQLGSMVEAIGRTTVVGEDDAWILPRSVAVRQRVVDSTVPFVVGEMVRDWCLSDLPVVVYPYTSLGGPPIRGDSYVVTHWLWPYRTMLRHRSVFGKTLHNMGRPWYEHLEHYTDKLATPLSITFAFVATHNHFVLDRGGKVFNRSAPVIKLPAGAAEDDHLALLGLLNSSTACFWMKQVFYPKGGDSTGKRMQSEPWSKRFEFDGTKIRAAPVPHRLRDRVVQIAHRLDTLGQQLSVESPDRVLEHAESTRDLPRLMRECELRRTMLLREMIAWQEELDWTVYAAYGLVDDDQLIPLDSLEPLASEHRPFAIHLACETERGAATKYWFETMRVQPTTAVPIGYQPTTLEHLRNRLKLLTHDALIALLEHPNYKRRWHMEPWEERLDRSVTHWLLNRLENATYWSSLELTSCAQLADRAREDLAFMQVAEMHCGSPDFDVASLVAGLVGGASVPLLPALRYTASGLRKREAWERTWARQRLEDVTYDTRSNLPSDSRIPPSGAQCSGSPPVPPKYTSDDFQCDDYWRLRDKLDVAKERFVSFPHCEREGDSSLVVGWAGWNHLEQAEAVAAYYVARKDIDGWTPERLTPLLAGILELVPWLEQWHNEVDAEYGVGMGDYYRSFVETETRALGLTPQYLPEWKPPVGKKRGRAKAKARLKAS